MEQKPDTDQPHASGAPEGKVVMTAFEVGAVLREARENSGMSISDVANRLKFAQDKITALEEGDISKLQGITFARGFVRSYARLLQLDEEPLLDALPGTPVIEPSSERKNLGVPIPDAYAARRSNILWLASALLVVLALGMFAWRHDRNPPQPETETSAANVSPAASAVGRTLLPESAPAIVPPAESVSRTGVAAASPPSAVGKKPQPAAVSETVKHESTGQAATLHIVCDEDSWIEVRNGEDTVLLSQMCLAGSERTLYRAPPYSVVIGYAKGVKLYFRGDPVDLAPHTRTDVARLTLE
jgi:cytoskeleton protein RodZ